MYFVSQKTLFRTPRKPALNGQLTGLKEKMSALSTSPETSRYIGPPKTPATTHVVE
jgi:hypothetical protein